MYAAGKSRADFHADRLTSLEMEGYCGFNNAYQPRVLTPTDGAPQR